MKNINSSRYIYDALYGPIHLDSIVWGIIPCPELQRLREVRLCNINSLCITGGANINRYEHAIGTCFLAQQCIDSWSLINQISAKERRIVLLAALLHDVANAAFGHSLEYLEEKEGYDPEKGFELAIIGDRNGKYHYKTATTQPIFFGMPRELLTKITQEELAEIAEMIRGKGNLGCLISGVIDLDNIDNVFRMAYHVGLVKSGEVPLKLAKSIWVDKGKLIIKEESIPLIEEWFNIRKRMYEILLLNPEEFSGKCMLSDSISLSKLKGQVPFSWCDVDYDLLKNLSRVSDVRYSIKEFRFELDISFKDLLDHQNLNEELINIFKSNKINISNRVNIVVNRIGESWNLKEGSNEYPIECMDGKLIVHKVITKSFNISNTILRLMSGNLYGCIGIYSTKLINRYKDFLNIHTKLEVEHELSKRMYTCGGHLLNAIIAIHPILDSNKTQRQVTIQSEKGNIIQIGTSSKQLLLGVFFRNVDLSMYKMVDINYNELIKARRTVYEFLSNLLRDDDLKEVELYAEAKSTDSNF